MHVFTPSLAFYGLLSLVIGLISPVGASAQNFPSKPIRMVVAYPAGGTADLQARLIAEDVGRLLGQPILIDNKPGGGGAISVVETLNAPHDGHTVLLHIDSIATEIPHSIKTSYDVFNDIKPLVETSRTRMVFVANAAVPANSISEFVTFAQRNPRSINWGSYGQGTAGHILNAVFNKSTGLDIAHVPYKGSGPGLADMAAGLIHAGVYGEQSVQPFLASKRVKALAITTRERSPLLPAVPTVFEAGFPELELVLRLLLFVPTNTPAAAQARLRDAVVEVLQRPAMRKRMTDAGLVPVTTFLSPDELSTMLRVEHDRFGKVLQSIGYKPDNAPR